MKKPQRDEAGRAERGTLPEAPGLRASVDRALAAACLERSADLFSLIHALTRRVDVLERRSR